LISGIVPRKVEAFFIKALRPKPIFHHEKCISCGDCMRGCPAKIIKMKNGKPIADLEKCISCFCCHELCPAKAIDIKVHWLHKILFGTK
jgi:MinD superfamily P-loop ATPase